jgi:hypothetical protein
MFTDTLAFDAIDLSNFTGYRTFITSLSAEMFTTVPGNMAFEDKMMIFPNPATDKIFIMHPVVSDFQTEIYNVAGQLVQSVKIALHAPLDVSDFKPGIYIVCLVDNSGTRIGIGKFLKK